MAVIPKPPTMRDQVDQLWFAIIGSNGDGLASLVRDTRNRVEIIEKRLPEFWTVEDHKQAQKAACENTERRKMTSREKAMLAATFIGSLSGLGAMVVMILK